MKPWLGTGFAFCLLGVTTAQTGWISRATPVAPPARGFHDLAYDLARGVTVLFGGWDNNTYFGDTWEWNGVVWTQRVTTTAPSPRLAHSMAYDLGRSRVVLFGGAVGSSSGTDNDETWEWDGVTWMQIQPAIHPSPRRGANMTYDPARGVCVLFGGGLTPFGTPVLDDTWEWNGSTWTQHLPSVRPPARWNCFLAADWSAGHVVMSGGGVGVNSVWNDTWTWNGAVWQQLTPTVQPTARRYGGAAFDVQRGVVVAWSGLVPAATADSSTWVWDGGNWRQDARPSAPPGRWATAAAYDVIRARMVVFGGYAGRTMQDTWEYAAGPLATCTVSGPGCPGTSGVPSLTNLAGALPVLGTTWTLSLGYGASNGVAALAVGLSDQAWSGGPLPFDLTAFGMPGCTLRTSTDWVGGLTLLSGNASLPWALPASSSLAGVQVFAQALVLEPGTNALGAVLSNALAAATGPY
jgi:hypothetical protein